jgi:hypothetical protein
MIAVGGCLPQIGWHAPELQAKGVFARVYTLFASPGTCHPRPSLSCLLFAIGTAMAIAPARAAPPVLRDYLRACGISDADFARFDDDRQMADEELDVVRRIAVRLRDGPADALHRMTAPEPGGNSQLSPEIPSRAGAKEHRGQPARLRGRVESIEPVVETGWHVPELAKGVVIGQTRPSLEAQGRATPGSTVAAEPIWRCVITSEDRPHRAIVYAAEMPAELRRASGQQVAMDAAFVKYVPGARDVPVPVFAAPRLQRRAAGPLGELDFDSVLLDGIRDCAPISAADSGAFYRLLTLTRSADATRIRREATVLDSSAARLLFDDPAAERGHILRVAGIARRVVRVPIEDRAAAVLVGADHYFQIDMLADALQDNPLVFCTLDLPPGMPLGGPPSFSQPIEVTGFFLKMWQYPTGMTAGERAEHPGDSAAWQTAPLLVGPQPDWKPSPVLKKGGFDWLAGGILVLAMTGLGLLLLHLRQSDQEFSSRNQL